MSSDDTRKVTKVNLELRALLPHTARFLEVCPGYERELVTAWQLGAMSFGRHPLLSLLWSRPITGRIVEFDDAVRAVMPFLKPADARGLARRITKAGSAGFRDATSAMAELLVAGLFARAGADVAFVACTDEKTNDIRASRDGATVHVEVASLNISDDNQRTETAVQQAVYAWSASSTDVPDELKGRARHSGDDSGFVRIVEYNVLPFGGGTIGQRITRLAGKKRDTQLRGVGPNTMIVNSFWHEFGVSRREALPTYQGHTGVVFAATYGLREDPILDGFRWDGQDTSTDSVKHPGILPRSNVLSGVAWLFHLGGPVVFERLDGTPHFNDEARRLVRDALDAGDCYSRFR